MARVLSHPQHSQSYLPQHIGDACGRGRLRTSGAVNVSIASDRFPQKSNLPLRTTSFTVDRHLDRGDNATVGSDYSRKSADFHPTANSHVPKPIVYRASEKGSAGVLPLTSPRGGYVSDSVWSRSGRCSSSMENASSISQKLRRRTTSTDILNQADHRHTQWPTSDYSLKSNKPRTPYPLLKLQQIRKREWLQLCILCGILCFVGESYRKAVSTSELLAQFKMDESMMMMHLQRVEQQSIHLHENLSRLGDVSGAISASDQILNDREGQAPSENVDMNLIRVQTQQLHQMEEELDHELRALQAKLQHVARSSIATNYGEGPVKVVMELDFPDEPLESGKNTITILLWYDTPHAAWTWLDQIRKNEWNGSTFKLGKTSSIDASPVISNAGTLNFIEKAQKGHEAWTVGLADTDGNLGMFINLRDVEEIRKHEVCVGKIIDGFDTLQRLVDVARGDVERPVRIHRASASHMTMQ